MFGARLDARATWFGNDTLLRVSLLFVVRSQLIRRVSRVRNLGIYAVCRVDLCDARSTRRVSIDLQAQGTRYTQK